MTTRPLEPLSFALRKAITLDAMQQAADNGQTTLVCTLMRLDELCNEIDFAVVQYAHQLQQLTEAIDLLFTGLDRAPCQTLSTEAVRHLLKPILHQLQNVHCGLDALH
jgi:hypothetical protein